MPDVRIGGFGFRPPEVPMEKPMVVNYCQGNVLKAQNGQPRPCQRPMWQLGVGPVEFYHPYYGRVCSECKRAVGRWDEVLMMFPNADRWGPPYDPRMDPENDSYYQSGVRRFKWALRDTGQKKQGGLRRLDGSEDIL